MQRNTSGSLTIKDTVINTGIASSTVSTTVTYYIWDGEDPGTKLRIGQRSITALRQAARSSGTTVLKIPADLEPGTWYIQAIIDESNRIKEFNGESNNISPDILLP